MEALLAVAVRAVLTPEATALVNSHALVKLVEETAVAALAVNPETQNGVVAQT
jgi:hypothetical protein